MVDKAKSGNARKPASWQVKGISYETREAVKRAAGRSGKSIGVWVNDTLHRAATEELTGKNTLPAVRLEEQLSEISDKLDALNQPQSFWGRLFKR